MRTKYKHKFDRMYCIPHVRTSAYGCRLKPYSCRWVERRYSRPSDCSWRISLFGFEWSFWFKTHTGMNPRSYSDRRPENECACGLDKTNPKAKHQWWCPDKQKEKK